MLMDFDNLGDIASGALENVGEAVQKNALEKVAEKAGAALKNTGKSLFSGNAQEPPASDQAPSPPVKVPAAGGSDTPAPDQNEDPPRSGWHHVYEEGHLVRQSHYREGVLDGAMIFYDAGGRVEKKLTYEKGILQGPALFFSEGQLVLQSYFMNGKQEGGVVSYKENGGLLSRLTYSEGSQHGMAIYYDEDGFPAQVEYYANNKKDGPCVSYYPSGLVLRSGQFKEGLEDGTFVQYYEDRSLMQVIVYDKGKIIKGPVDYPPPNAPKKKA